MSKNRTDLFGYVIKALKSLHFNKFFVFNSPMDLRLFEQEFEKIIENYEEIIQNFSENILKSIKLLEEFKKRAKN